MMSSAMAGGFTVTSYSMAFVGEPLLEYLDEPGLAARAGLAASADLVPSMGVAGDVLNVAVAVSHLAGNTSLVTALGADSDSEAILEFARNHKISCDTVSIDETRKAGSYRISNDQWGERSFTYNRDNSAARRFFSEGETLLKGLKPLETNSHVYFSGITLALMTESSRSEFVRWLDDFRSRDGVVVFDNNYRPALWPAPSQYQAVCDEILKRVDVFLPSLDDVMATLETSDREKALAWVKDTGVNEIVISDGVNPMLLIEQGVLSIHEVEPVAGVVDTTGAGDVFNGGYLAARLRGQSARTAINSGMALAADIVRHRGAVLPLSYWRQRDAVNDQK